MIWVPPGGGAPVPTVTQLLRGWVDVVAQKDVSGKTRYLKCECCSWQNGAGAPPSAPCSEGFPLPPTLAGAPVSASKPLAPQPHRRGTGTDEGGLSRGETGPPQAGGCQLGSPSSPCSSCFHCGDGWRGRSEKIMSKGRTCLDKRREGHTGVGTVEEGREGGVGGRASLVIQGLGSFFLFWNLRNLP